MRKLATATMVMAAFAISSPVEAAKKPKLTPMELQAIQQREFEATKEALFAAVMTVIQDLGYQVGSADYQTGFITAESATTRKTNFWEALGGVRSSGNTRLTAFIEAMPSGMSRVRLNLVNTKNVSAWYGQSERNDKPILDPEAYKVAWEKIDEALFVRQAVVEGSAPATGAVPETQPAADMESD